MNIKDEILETEIKLDKLRRRRAAQKSNTKLTCKRCKYKFKIKDVPFEQHYYYVHPSGCMDGDYWAVDDSNSGFKCPTCAIYYRLLTEKLLKLKHNFKAIVKVYGPAPKPSINLR